MLATLTTDPPKRGDNFEFVGYLKTSPRPPQGPREEAVDGSSPTGTASSGGQGCEHCSCVHQEGAACCECEYAPVREEAA